MKSVGKCDVEISITLDGMETVEPVPECLQEVFLNHRTVPFPENHVNLPKRYAQWINNRTDAEKMALEQEVADDKLTDRERDLGTALSWVKQEIKILKEQDRILMRKFVTLRSKIMQLRCVYDGMYSSNSDLSVDGSTVSLDDIPDSPCPSPVPLSPAIESRVGDSITELCSGQNCLKSPDTDINKFRPRTSSLLLPCHSFSLKPVTRIKWKSHEYL